MKRGRLEIIGEFLLKIHDNPKLSPSQISGYMGLNYPVAKKIIESNLVQKIQDRKGRRSLVLTEVGKQALQHYQNFIQAIGDCLK